MILTDAKFIIKRILKKHYNGGDNIKINGLNISTPNGFNIKLNISQNTSLK